MTKTINMSSWKRVNTLETSFDFVKHRINNIKHRMTNALLLEKIHGGEQISSCPWQLVLDSVRICSLHMKKVLENTFTWGSLVLVRRITWQQALQYNAMQALVSTSMQASLTVLTHYRKEKKSKSVVCPSFRGGKCKCLLNRFGVFIKILIVTSRSYPAHNLHHQTAVEFGIIDERC